MRILPTPYVSSYASSISDALIELHPRPIQAIWKRKVSVYRQIGQTERAVQLLITYVETFYADPDAWLELANIYASCNLCVDVSLVSCTQFRP